jgi:hypothetical protein
MSNAVQILDFEQPIAEIERQIKDANSHDAMVLVDLVDRLKMQGKYDLGKVPTK